jgi:hypothetical protein
VWTTGEGPVVITRKGKMVFVSESFDLPVARKLATLILASQGSGPLQNASVTGSFAAPDGGAYLVGRATPSKSLTAPLVHFMSNCGAIKSVVESATKGTRRIAFQP